METAVIAKCGRCGTKNRIPEKRQHERPRCGKCGAAFDLAAQAVPVELGDHDLQAFLAGCRLPVMVDFHSPDCGPCRALAPVIEALARRFFGRVVIAKLDTRRHPVSATHYGIRGVPTLLFFRNGQVFDQVVGAPPESLLAEKLGRLAAGFQAK